MIVFFRSEERTFYEYCFAKSDRDNISEKDLRIFKNKAKINLTMTNDKLSNDLRKRVLIEI